MARIYMAQDEVTDEITRAAQYLVSERLSSWDFPRDVGAQVVDAFTLMDAIVNAATNDGMTYAKPSLLKRVAWWNDQWDQEVVKGWLSILVEWGEITIEPLGRNSYDVEGTFDVIVIQNRRRFKRWHPRPNFTAAMRVAVYARDNGLCLHCGATENLSIDHIYPWSKGGLHEMDNFQTLCRSCNSKKGARV
jgi:hypothetical protein